MVFDRLLVPTAHMADAAADTGSSLTCESTSTGRGGSCAGKTGPTKPHPTKKCPTNSDPNIPSNDATPQKDIDIGSHPSPPSIHNEMTPDNEKIPLLPPIQLLNSNATSSSQSIISEVSSTTNVTV